MKNIVIFLFMLCSLYASAYGASDNRDEANIYTFPGTGVGMEIPEGMKPSPAGTSLINESMTMIVFVFGGDSKVQRLEDDRLYRALYPTTPEAVPGLGNLYRRTRAEHGGKWDGWWLVANRGEAELDVVASYTGTDPNEFENLKKLFSTLHWKEGSSDAELAFGLTTSVPGLRAAHNLFGGLFFSVDGKRNPPQGERQLGLMALPTPPDKLDQSKLAVATICASEFMAFRGQPYTGPNKFEGNGINGCDGWGKEENGDATYVAYLVMPDGAIVSALGTGDPWQFRSSLLNLHATR